MKKDNPTNQLKDSKLKTGKVPYKPRLKAKSILLAALVPFVVLGICLGFLWKKQKATILKQEEKRAEFMVRSLEPSLQFFMLRANGTLVRKWLNKVSQTPGMIKVQIIRRDGTEAFRDLETIKLVNSEIGVERFRRKPLPIFKVPDIPRQEFDLALKGQPATFFDLAEDRLTYLLPIPRQANCESCHGYDSSPVRGIFRVTTSLSLAREHISSMSQNLLGIAVLMSLILGITLRAAFRWNILSKFKKNEPT